MLKSEILDISKYTVLSSKNLWDFDDKLMHDHPAVGILYALKALRDKNEENNLSAHFLQEAASRLTDRKQLFHFLHNLKDYEDKKEISAIAPVEVAEIPVAEQEEVQNVHAETEEVADVQPIETTHIVQETVAETVLPIENESIPVTEMEDPYKGEKHTFIEWIKIFQSGNIEQKQPPKHAQEIEKEESPQTQPIAESTAPDEKEKEENTAEEAVLEDEGLKYADELAKKSITFNWDNATETLAKLYAKQGKKQKAIEVYKYLTLKYPSKSSYFATQIENLEK